MSLDTQSDKFAPSSQPNSQQVTPQSVARPFMRRPILTGAAAIALAIGAFGVGQVLSPGEISAQQISTQAPKAATMLPSFADLVERVSPAVVSLEVVAVSEAPSGGPSMEDLEGLPPQLRRFFEQMPNQRDGQQARPREQIGGGSGFFISSTGYIVTNNHVVEKAKEITATLKDGRELKAKIIGRDERTDLAVLKVEGGSFPYVQFAPEAKVRVGDWVVAIGNPFDLGGTATAGIISALGRDFRGESNIADFMQIDAPINPGNSGGPTFDMSGRVIGVNTAIFTRSGGNIGIGFAIPASLADRTTKQIIAQGKVTYGWLGVTIQDVSREMADSFGLGADAKGALIANVSPGAPAAKAGLKRGDVVLKFNGQKIEGSSDLTRRVGQTNVGEVVKLEIAGADGSRRTVSVTIAARPSEQQLARGDATGPDGVPPSAAAASSALGLSVGPLSAQARTRLRLPPNEAGVLILEVDPDSKAAKRGIRAGDAILTANDKEVRSSEELEAAVKAARAAGRAFIGLFIQSQAGGGGFVALPLDAEESDAPSRPKK
ncbi:Do family serine endopeptidase [Candidatus Phycosocius spiralis]|uniref:Serine protease n=1 Tax=Candidatus Phycosocius spiralis TaxID=2815099 RepID=A0ABQ4PX58_9PROT|nr:Do family serine endopeptidase [Candidatus Phycosocius spiralis]GIU67598.1 serine protease [Candidatus Phycosocius spiralis]